MTILNMLGLVTAETHAKLDDLFATVARERNEALIEAADATEKFKKAVKDLAENSTTIATLQHNAGLDRDAIEKQSARIAELNAEIAALKTDAEKLRSKRANDAALKREKRAAAKAQPIAA